MENRGTFHDCSMAGAEITESWNSVYVLVKIALLDEGVGGSYIIYYHWYLKFMCFFNHVPYTLPVIK